MSEKDRQGRLAVDFTTMSPDEFRTTHWIHDQYTRIVDTDPIAVLSTTGRGVFLGTLADYIKFRVWEGTSDE